MTALQPDQRPEAWNDFVSAYERMFEPLTDAFAAQVFDRLGSLDGLRLADIACGPGGAALIAARRGADVLAVDASPPMVDRVRARGEPGLKLAAGVMDAAKLEIPASSMDIAYSGFGVILLPDPVVGLRQMIRILRPSGRAAIVTWTEPENYQLAALLRECASEVRDDSNAQTGTPAQLRYMDPTVFMRLLTSAGFTAPDVMRMEAALRAPSVHALIDNLAFAPGMSMALEAFGPDRKEIVAVLAKILTKRFGEGAVELRAVAHVANARSPVD